MQSEDNRPCNPYDLPHSTQAKTDSTRWSGGMALGRPSNVAQPEDTKLNDTQMTVADKGRCLSVKARDTAFRMRYRREPGQAPNFLRRWG